VPCSRNDLAMSETWYPLALKVDGRTLFLLWVSDDWALNRVRADAGPVVSFSDERSAREFALAENLTVAPEEEFRLHDLDSAAHWLEADAEPDCRLLLAIWNLAGDVARSVNEPFEDRGGVLDDVYNKLLFGNNLPSITPPGEQYHPEWTEEELGLLRASIEMAVDLIRSRVVAPGWRSGPA
jgi:hypothetical protein